MTEASGTPPPARPSATVVLLRGGEKKLEVFMVERHHQIDFATGASVFPGGKVEASDRDERIRARTRGAETLADEALAYRVAAIRETFEESGILIAGERGRGEPIGRARLHELDARHRRALQAGETGLADVIEAEELELLCDRFVHFAHWITPLFMPKRFDTHFYLVEAPSGQVARHDGSESVDSAWLTIDEALEQQRLGQRKIIFPTLAQLEKLGRSSNGSEALETARREAVVTVLPELSKDAEGRPCLTVPREAGYSLSSVLLDNIA